jgi:hypothetical protein
MLEAIGRGCVKRPPVNSTNPVKNSPFQVSSFIPTSASIYKTMRVSQRRMHSIPTGDWPSEAFWQVYIARQSSPGLMGESGQFRSFLRQVVCGSGPTHTRRTTLPWMKVSEMLIAHMSVSMKGFAKHHIPILTARLTSPRQNGY